MESTMETYHLTYDDVRHSANLVIDEVGGNFVYRGACVYSEHERQLLDGEDTTLPSKPACLVGHILVKCGVPLERFRTLSGVSSDRESFRVRGITFTPQALLFLDTCQVIQDTVAIADDINLPWSKIVSMAYATIARNTCLLKDEIPA